MFANRSTAFQRGITMVEMALVILIIGGLIGAILGTKEIIRVTRLRKIAAETESFGVAARTFEDKYDQLPGDFDSAGERIAGCEVDAGGLPNNPNFCQDGDGNGTIGRYCHFMATECNQTGAAAIAAHPEALETTMFWKHLFLSGLITGIVDPRANPATPRWGVSHPESAVWDAGYVVSSQGGFIGGSVNINFVPQPTYMTMSTPSGAQNERALNIIDAHYLDEKYDDGNPGNGKIWWNPISTDHSGCRAADNGPQSTWEDQNGMYKNCIFSWTVF